MKEISKAYNPQDNEQDIYKLWENSGAFKPKIDPDKEPFVISMPPPNVTGKLHIGHALFITIQDILTRYHRMKGEPTLWLPGTDHAGIATQTVVEKALQKKGINRRELGREKFVEEVWKWKELYGGEITHQLRSVGASCDWSREKFTLDEDLSKAVNHAFVHFYNEGLIYRGLRTVNWCPRCHTAIADDEVEYQKETGKFYWIKYGPFILATARPETKLGDTAVAVHPSDKRYQDMVGKKYMIPGVLGEFEVEVVADNAVDPKFGTGAVKVTPGHSLIDFEISQRHNLPIKQVIDENGRMMENTGKYAGLKTREAREMIVEDMQKMGLIDHIEENYEHNIATCYRCHGQIEPIPSKQWFVKMKPLAEKARKTVEDGQVKIVPKRFEKVYYQWMDNIRDWCISRQLWWGHRIPVWYKKEEFGIKGQKSNIKNVEDIPKLSEANDYIKGLKNMKPGEAGSPVKVKSGKEYRYTLSEEDLAWVNDNFSEERNYEIIDFYDGETRIRVSGGVVVRTPKKTQVKGVVKKIAKAGKINGIECYLEKRITEGFSRYEIEFKNNRPDYFENKKTIASDDILQYQNLTNEEEIYVGVEPPKDIENWTQEEDVLDTWFSSGLWPFSTLGWPDENAADYKYFYPTTVMETGYDILFFWVARMIMMGVELTGKAPFKTVYLHGLVRDEKNRKMSKSLGNVLDPLEISAKFGTDAMRMALVVGTTAGNDIAVGESKIRGYRNFANKIWNIARFVLMCLEQFDQQNATKQQIAEAKYSPQDKKDFERLDEIVKKTTKYLENFHFSHAGELLYDYTWHEFADKIIEEAKTRIQGDNEEDRKAALFKLLVILQSILKLLHPFVPFVTETIWQKLPSELKDSDLLITAEWPK